MPWRASTPYFASWTDATDNDRAEWELWIRTVLMPQPLLDLAAHVWEYEALIARWDGDDRSKMVPEIVFPTETLLPYVGENFIALKREQASLLATRATPRDRYGGSNVARVHAS